MYCNQERSAEESVTVHLKVVVPHLLAETDDNYEISQSS
jgi:hypothetical protein